MNKFLTFANIINIVLIIFFPDYRVLSLYITTSILLLTNMYLHKERKTTDIILENQVKISEWATQITKILKEYGGK